MNVMDKILGIAFVTIILSLIVFNSLSPGIQDFIIIDCDSGFCDSHEASLSRSTIVGNYLCSETPTAQAFINVDRSYDSLYVFNRDGAAGNDLFSEEIGGHGAIVYQLLTANEDSYLIDNSQTKKLFYGENDFFTLTTGVGYRVDVYACDLPSSLSSCEETDNGLKPLIFGKTTTTFNIYEDVCSTDTLLLERYCDEDNSIASKTVICSDYGNNYICEAGACVEKGVIAQIKNNKWLVIGIIITVLIIFFYLKKRRSFNAPMVGKNRSRRFTK